MGVVGSHCSETSREQRSAKWADTLETHVSDEEMAIASVRMSSGDSHSEAFQEFLIARTFALANFDCTIVLHGKRAKLSILRSS